MNKSLVKRMLSIYLIIVLLFSINVMQSVFVYAADNTLGKFPSYPEDGQKYWVVFSEGTRSGRIELTTCDFYGDSQNAWICWNRSLTLKGVSAVGKYNQYYLSEDGVWVKRGTYSKFTDYAMDVYASNLDIYNGKGEKILSRYMDYNDLANKYINPFYDVSNNTYYYDSVLWAVGQGITSGTSKNYFSPNNSCTRAQVVTFLWRAAGEPKVSSDILSFVDVSKYEYYYDAVKWAVSKGITSGTSVNTFEPDAPCTRGQVVTFLWRAAGSPYVIKGSSVNGNGIMNPISFNSSFVDVSKDAYYFNAVEWAVTKGITSGTSNTTFSPDKICTRAEVVTFLYRYYK